MTQRSPPDSDINAVSISTHPKGDLPFLGHFFCHDFHLPTAPAFSTFSTQCWSASTPCPWHHHFFGALPPNFITVKTSRRQKEAAPPCFESTQSPNMVFWGWHFWFLSGSKALWKDLTAWDSRDMATLGLCSQCLTSLISPLADILTLQRGKIPTEGPVRYPDNKSHIFPKNSNLEFHGGGPKLLECYCLVFPRKLFKPGTFKQQWQSPTQEGLEGSTAVNPVDQGWLEQTRMCQLKETGLQCVPCVKYNIQIQHESLTEGQSRSWQAPPGLWQPEHKSSIPAQLSMKWPLQQSH